MKTRFLYLFTFFVLLLAAGCGNNEPVSPDAPRQFNQQHLDKLNASKRFNYEKEVARKNTPILNFLSELIRIIFWLFSNVIGYVILLFLIVLLVWIIVKNIDKTSFKKDSAPKSVILDLAPDELEVKDYEMFIRNALSNEDYRLAIRYTFLKLLRTLQDKELIKWHKEKTNYEYLYELPGEYQPLFSKLVRNYEYIWYGEFDADQNQYQWVHSKASDLIQRPTA